jgi:hypothetical protein
MFRPRFFLRTLFVLVTINRKHTDSDELPET